MKNVPGMKVMKVCTARDKIEAEMILDILGQHNISAFRQGNASGGAMDIYAGNSIYGETIYADESEVEEAQDLIRNIIEGVDESELEDEEMEDEVDSE